MRWIKEDNYETLMHTEAEPYVAARREVGFDSRVKGQPIYYEHYTSDNPKAVIVISHGFTESIQKFTESIYYMLQAGYNVWGLDHRGHGHSYRINDNPYVVHVDRFKDYVLDLKHLTEKRSNPLPANFQFTSTAIPWGDVSAHGRLKGIQSCLTKQYCHPRCLD